MSTTTRIVLFLVLSYTAAPALAAVDFPQCFRNVRDGLNGTEGVTDNQGNLLPSFTNMSAATSITYDRCIELCGSGQGSFDWSSFSQQFSAWLLPWLALLSQFPFGSRYNWDNLVSVLLALGSPMLAAYSLALTVLNTKWILRRFTDIQYPNKEYAAKILASLQQMAVKVTPVSEDGHPLLASLIVVPKNDAWWEKVEENLNYADMHSWSISSWTSIAWVVIAYILTIFDAFTTISTDPNSNGSGLSGVGSIWLWMIPVTIGYLQLSPRSDCFRVERALKKANEIPLVAGPANTIVEVDTLTEERGLSILNHSHKDTLYSDQEASAPIYNYARFLSFVHVVDEIASSSEAASRKARRREPVAGPTVQWQPSLPGQGRAVNPENRVGTTSQIERYCDDPPYVRRSHWGFGVFTLFVIASLAAFALQWATSGASILIVFFTPTVGLGCRSFAYTLYAGTATFVWMLLVLSSFLAHYATAYPRGTPPRSPHIVARHVAITLRRVAKLLATLNAGFIIVTFFAQFANRFDSCYCNADVLGLRKRAHIVMVLLGPDIARMKAAWVGGIALAVIFSGAWLGFIYVIFESLPMPSSS
ncbi:hypothetical protein MKEN_00910000 [Mycena kentingensis (nom. inval.)]|nr:hypothetical protein MKEN_00910000 [Mycena kentingensis (nom. inval.)]